MCINCGHAIQILAYLSGGAQAVQKAQQVLLIANRQSLKFIDTVPGITANSTMLHNGIHNG